MVLVTVVEPLVVVAAADPAALRELSPALSGWGCRVKSISDSGQLTATLATESPALLLLDARLEPDGGERLFREHPGLPVALLADRDPSRAGEAAGRRGAFDYVTWPLDPHRLRVILAHAIERHRLLERIRGLESLAASPAGDASDSHLREIDRLEKRAIVDALRRAGANVREAARLLGFGQATVYRKIKRYGIVLPARGRQESDGVGFSSLPPDPARSCG